MTFGGHGNHQEISGGVIVAVRLLLAVLVALTVGHFVVGVASQAGLQRRRRGGAREWLRTLTKPPTFFPLLRFGTCETYSSTNSLVVILVLLLLLPHPTAPVDVSTCAATVPSLPRGTVHETYGDQPCNSPYAGTILIAGPASLAKSGKYNDVSTTMRNSLKMFVDYVNKERGGVRVSSKTYGVRFRWVDDASSPSVAGVATSQAIFGQPAVPDGGLGGTPDFVIGPYSSKLTSVVAAVAQAAPRVLISQGSSSTKIFTANSLAFGLMSPADASGTAMVSAVIAAADKTDADSKATAAPLRARVKRRCGMSGAVAGEKSCRGQLLFGLLLEGGSSSKAAVCQSGMTRAASDGIPVFGGKVTVVHKGATQAQVRAALKVFQQGGVTALCGCVYESMGMQIVQGLEDLNWAPFAVGLTDTANTLSYQSKMAAGWWQGEYVLAPTSWHKVSLLVLRCKREKGGVGSVSNRVWCLRSKEIG